MFRITYLFTICNVELETESDDHREKKGKAESKLEEWKVQLDLLLILNN